MPFAAVQQRIIVAVPPAYRVTIYRRFMLRIAQALALKHGAGALVTGDSLGQVVLGYDSTVPVTMGDMLHHIKTVVRGTEKAHIVGDLPFMSYHAEVSEAIRNAGRILKEGGAQSIKLEGGQEMAETVNRIVKSGIPVMGHVGLTPQSVNQLGGYRVQGKTISDAIRLMEDTRALEEAGAYAVVLECVPAALAQMITDRLSIPTIGIGAGAGCDGQVQVLHDFLGLFTDFLPKHARRYANLAETIQAAASQYISDVHLGEFPTDKESYKMSQSVLDELAGKVFESA